MLERLYWARFWRPLRRLWLRRYERGYVEGWKGCEETMVPRAYRDGQIQGAPD